MVSSLVLFSCQLRLLLFKLAIIRLCHILGRKESIIGASPLMDTLAHQNSVSSGMVLWSVVQLELRLLRAQRFPMDVLIIMLGLEAFKVQVRIFLELVDFK
jgi:hypothetical protein